MRSKEVDFGLLKNQLVEAARLQDNYDLQTVNLIAPASPTPLKYYYDLPLRHNAIAEGLLGDRPYAGVEGFNRIEEIAVKAACALFNADHANVQPHSVSQANQAVYQALLENDDRVLAMGFHAGGHLTHGLKINFSGKLYDFGFYEVNANGYLDYEEIKKKATDFRPKLIVCGASSYPRIIDFEKLKNIANQVGARLMADLSHPAGLIVAKRFPQPFPHCDVVTLTPDKTMLGPHGGIILCKKEISSKIDKAVHPGTQSSIPLRRVFETAMCLLDIGEPWFVEFIDRVLVNIKAFERVFNKVDGLMITNGSDTHLMVINTYDTFGLTGVEAEGLLESIGILTNRQVVPREKLKSYVASGIRLGTTWISARGYLEEEAEQIAQVILENLGDPNNETLQKESKQKMDQLVALKRINDVWTNEEIR